MKRRSAELIARDPERFFHHDRVFLNNPVVMQGMGLAPLVVLATNGQNALMLAAAVALLLVPSRVLACLLSRLCPLRDERPAPEELEKKLALCPAIIECIVKEKGQKICAVVYCPEDKQEEVRAFVTEVNRSLPLYKRISAVEFTAEPLPRNALGKLLRK